VISVLSAAVLALLGTQPSDELMAQDLAAAAGKLNRLVLRNEAEQRRNLLGTRRCRQT
jgi:hypothetical protein